jgi:hypothetical protein
MGAEIGGESVTIKVEAYACEYCHRVLQTRASASNHERNLCKYSPLARRCDGCANLALPEPDTGWSYIGCKVGCQIYSRDDGRLLWRKHCPEFVSKYPNGSLRKQVDDERKAK